MWILVNQKMNIALLSPRIHPRSSMPMQFSVQCILFNRQDHPYVATLGEDREQIVIRNLNIIDEQFIDLQIRDGACYLVDDARDADVAVDRWKEKTIYVKGTWMECEAI